eukprot:Blabericola_migrator_1__8657@NODE_4546_length_1095_cov_92_054475_g2820_i0_p1_GENE_NODE_4546_length_1095_cov_92_054475_g2820_i0NODE_4546_length_1095_cov_92_054475_g2820_i0_p1_ORF_typecomplete_len226_score57_57PRCC/PF10253_9/1_8e12_NODE_4546_length_1095_cov_92_054475_g2820_i060737
MAEDGRRKRVREEDEDATSRLSSKPRMFSVLESLDDEEIEEDAEFYKQQLDKEESDLEDAPGLDWDSGAEEMPVVSIFEQLEQNKTDLSAAPQEEEAELPEKEQAKEAPLLEGYESSSDDEADDAAHDRVDSVVDVKLLQRLGVKDSTKLSTITASDMREKDWSYTTHGGVLPPAAARTEHSVNQKRKHQITWLAANVVEDEKRIEELAQKARENRFKSRQRYGF